MFTLSDYRGVQPYSYIYLGSFKKNEFSISKGVSPDELINSVINFYFVMFNIYFVGQ